MCPHMTDRSKGFISINNLKAGKLFTLYLAGKTL